MYYYGTSLTSAGHYFFNLTGGQYLTRCEYSEMDLHKIPFNPEELPEKPPRILNLQDGTTGFYHFGEYSVFAIEGSCSDSRPGSKSVFFRKKIVTKEEFIDDMKSMPIVKQIINQMPFPVAGLKAHNEQL